MDWIAAISFVRKRAFAEFTHVKIFAALNDNHRVVNRVFR